MSDPTLDDLQAWFAKHDRGALSRAYEALQREVQSILRRLEPWHSHTAIRERAQEIVGCLLFPPVEQQPPGRPTKLLPAQGLHAEEAARSYRARTFHRFLIDEQRTRLRQQELAQAAANPVTAASIRDARRRRRANQLVAATAQPRSQPDSEITSAAARSASAEERVVDRISIRRAFEKLSNVRYRAIIAFECDFDLTPFLAELASLLGRDEGELARELDTLFPSAEEALIRLFHPQPTPMAKARENFGRARRRALNELRAILGKELEI